jgi:hypothetical protein
MDWSCIFGWPVLGIWPKRDVTEASAGGTSLPEPTCVHRSPHHKYLAVGYVNGEVRIYNYPCINREV